MIAYSIIVHQSLADSSSIDVLYPDPSDSYTGGLFPGSTSFDWSSPDSSGEGRNQEGGQESCEERAFRPGNSRIPGKDHRRYYHSHWRLEYLMDFNACSHSMICMVCGSSLATLKLSTIKRHIQQKHPYSLTWTPCEKEVIIGGWDAHLCVDAQTLTGGEEQGADDSTVTPGPKKKRRRLPLASKGSWRPLLGSEISLPPPPDRSQIEQYMNESFKQWLRLEFLMDYDCQGDTLYCMMCATALPTLSINDIKKHILDNHPTSIYFNTAQKGIIVESWINRKAAPEEIVDVEDEMDEDEEEDAEVDLTKNLDEEDYLVEKTITDPRPQKNVGKENVNGETKENGQQKNVEPLEKDGLKLGNAQQLKKTKLESRNVTSLEEEKIGEEKEETNVEEAKLQDEGLKAEVVKKLEEHEKIREAQLEKATQKSNEPQLLEDEKLKASETNLLQEGQRKTKGAQLLMEETHKAKEGLAYQMRWRSHYLMDYNGLRGSVVCMYCCSSLTVLKDSSIKRHIVQKHPHTSNFSAEQKAAVLLDWENKLAEVKKLMAKHNMEGIVLGDPGVTPLQIPECDSVEDEEQEPSWAGALSEGKGASWEFAFGRMQGSAPKDPRKYQHDRWKLEFLMDYTPSKDGLICMVCGVTLINPKISTVKMHIQQKHLDTIYLSDQEKAVVIEEWEQRLSASKKGSGHQTGDDEICIEIKEDSTTSESHGTSAATCTPRTEIILPTISKPSKPTASLPPPCNSAKRSYQVRWRTEFMMDYDCRRQGLICMVCGGTLATLKVSTIKRHIVQVHPYSVDFTPEERQRILEAYSEMALHYIHSEECFKAQPQEEAKGRKRKATAVEDA
ncbi:zinc finger translocation-associated protein-like [Lithobates pipiens]